MLHARDAHDADQEMRTPERADIPPPFMADDMHTTHLNSGRVVESLVIAAVTAVISSLGSGYIASQVLAQQVHSLESQVLELKAEIRDLRKDLYQPRAGKQDLVLELPR